MNPHFILFNKFQHQFIKTPTSTVLSLILNCSIIQFIHIGIHTRNIPSSQWNHDIFKYLDIIQLTKSNQILNLGIFIITSIIPILIQQRIVQIIYIIFIFCALFSPQSAPQTQVRRKHIRKVVYQTTYNIRMDIFLL